MSAADHMELITILNRCHHFRGFVYEHARFSRNATTIEVTVRARRGSAAICSRCHLSAPGYDQLAERRFEFIPLWGYFVFLLYPMRRVDTPLRRRRRGRSPLGRRQAHPDQGLYALPSPLGAPPFLEGNGRSLSHFLRKGVRCGRTCHHFLQHLKAE
jgi:hypothetical protein